MPERKRFFLIEAFPNKKTSHELQTLSMSLSECQSLPPILLIQVSQFVMNSQLCHQVTKSLNLRLRLRLRLSLSFIVFRCLSSPLIVFHCLSLSFIVFHCLS